MRAYFTTSVRRILDIKDAVETIYHEMRKRGIEIDDFNSPEKINLKEDNIVSKSDTEIIEAYEYIKRSIKRSTFIIAELSNSSSAVGFEVAISMTERKPVLVLYDSTKVRKLSTPFRGNSSSYIKMYQYKYVGEIPGIIDRFLLYIKDFRDRKFNFQITPEMYAYLDRKAKEKGITKSEILRNLISEKIIKSI